MSIRQFKPTTSRNLLMTMLLVMVLAAALVYYYYIPIKTLYFHQSANFGLILNAVIVLLFLSGMLRIASLLSHYRKEEKATSDFLEHLVFGDEKNISKIDKSSIIVQRYIAMANLHKQGTTPDHGAMAQVLIARESLRGSLPRYVNNILILSGVFGTIVSLSVALLGTSSLLDNTEGSVAGINTVVTGMSTALTTTMTAIVLFGVFSYFYLRSNNVKIHLLATIEEITSDYLVPRFRVRVDNMAEDLAELILALRKAAHHINKLQLENSENNNLIRDTVIRQEAQLTELKESVVNMSNTLRQGFRLPEEES